jgi:hypothetical protein
VENDILIYIGMTNSDIESEINQELNRLELKNEDINIWVGFVDGSLDRITDDFIKDVESLMIYNEKPKLNDKSKDNYPGRNNIEVFILSINNPLKFQHYTFINGIFKND